MPMLCNICRKRYATKGKTLGFEHKGFWIVIYKDDSCCSYCKENEFKKMFKKYSHILTYAEGEVKNIDWRIFCKEAESGNEAEVVWLLLVLRVFSANPVGNWEVVDVRNLPLNPSFSKGIAYFTSYIDAARFALEKYPGDWHLRSIKENFNKEQVLKRGILI